MLGQVRPGKAGQDRLREVRPS